MDFLALAPVDMAMGLACLIFVLMWNGWRAAGDVANVAIWCSVGLWCCWWHAFKSQGQVRMRKPVEDNIRAARHICFIVSTLCIGSILVVTLEGMAALYITPWYLQLLANTGLSLGAFAMGSGIFGSSHDWVIKDPKLEPPLVLLNICVIS